MSFLYLLLVLGAYIQLAVAQVQPFAVTGFLDSANANPGTAANRGGTVTISGFTVKIPDNLLVEFPALFVPFAEFAAAGAAARAPPNEVSIVGNIVNNVIIAGQMSIAQLDLAGSSGIVESLGFDGRIKIKNGPFIRINDPREVYSDGFDELPFYTADDENPSITSFSGFPMCVPRSSNDPKCPSSNRPAGATTFTVTDATHMVPIQAGDYIEYSGVQFGGETICYGIVVNIGISTAGTQPGFVRVEDALIGIADNNPDVEAARFRFVGLASRADLPITIWAIDEDPCTGATTDRLLTTATVETAAARNKWKVDIPRGSNIGKYTRNYRIKIGDNIVTTTDGIRAGQYVQPVTEWIFPELVTPGGTPPPMDFSNIGPLRDGFGPGDDGTIFGQLNPWPGATAPAPLIANCAPATSTTTSTTSSPTSTSTTVPVLRADAGADQTVLSGLFVTLSATQLTPDVPAGELKYNWTQIAGPLLTLTSTTSPKLNISTPVIASGSVSREFLVVITHAPSGAKANDTVVVTCNRASTSFDHPVIDSLTWTNRQSGTATASVHTDLVDPAGGMRISFGNAAEAPMIRAGTVNGQALYTFNSRNVNRYTTATVRSYINGILVQGSSGSSANVVFL
ncbi:hypothetical protein B0O99DRAFT_591099 [Bisporella sp. PMI_857]|nr:hypothetical protein B0O99DRAFT_591099 [Bisporella sp. PMI_857]